MGRYINVGGKRIYLEDDKPMPQFKQGYDRYDTKKKDTTTEIAKSINAGADWLFGLPGRALNKVARGLGFNNVTENSGHTLVSTTAGPISLGYNALMNGIENIPNERAREITKAAVNVGLVGKGAKATYSKAKPIVNNIKDNIAVNRNPQINTVDEYGNPILALPDRIYRTHEFDFNRNGEPNIVRIKKIAPKITTYKNVIKDNIDLKNKLNDVGFTDDILDMSFDKGNRYYKAFKSILNANKKSFKNKDYREFRNFGDGWVPVDVSKDLTNLNYTTRGANGEVIGLSASEGLSRMNKDMNRLPIYNKFTINGDVAGRSMDSAYLGLLQAVRHMRNGKGIIRQSILPDIDIPNEYSHNKILTYMPKRILRYMSPLNMYGRAKLNDRKRIKDMNNYIAEINKNTNQKIPKAFHIPIIGSNGITFFPRLDYYKLQERYGGRKKMPIGGNMFIKNNNGKIVKNFGYNPLLSKVITIGGTFKGGKLNGSGATGRFTLTPRFNNMTFNEAFDKAREMKEPYFYYGEKLYNTKKELNPVREYNNRFAGNNKSRLVLKQNDEYQYQSGALQTPITGREYSVIDSIMRCGGRKKAWIGAAISAVAGIAGSLINKNKQDKAAAFAKRQQNIQNNMQTAQSLNQLLNANQDDYNDKLIFKCGGRRKAGLGLEQQEALNAGISSIGNITQSIISTPNVNNNLAILSDFSNRQFKRKGGKYELQPKIGLFIR